MTRIGQLWRNRFLRFNGLVQAVFKNRRVIAVGSWVCLLLLPLAHLGMSGAKGDAALTVIVGGASMISALGSGATTSISEFSMLIIDSSIPARTAN